MLLLVAVLGGGGAAFVLSCAKASACAERCCRLRCKCQVFEPSGTAAACTWVLRDGTVNRWPFMVTVQRVIRAFTAIRGRVAHVHTDRDTSRVQLYGEVPRRASAVAWISGFQNTEVRSLTTHPERYFESNGDLSAAPQPRGGGAPAPLDVSMQSDCITLSLK